MSAPDGYRAAVALVGARLRGDTEGETVLRGDCECACRPLVGGLLTAAEVALKTMAAHDKVTPEDAADVLDRALQVMDRGSR